MRNLLSHYTPSLMSMYSGPTILNMAGEEGDDGGQTDTLVDKQEEKDTTKPDEQGQDDDGSAGIDETTPAGKAFAIQRQKRKAAEKVAQDEREARIRAEAKAEAQGEILTQLGNIKQGDQEEKPAAAPAEIAPEDEAVIAAYLKKHGITDVLKALPEQVAAAKADAERVQMQTNIDKVFGTLEAKFKDSVPFNRDEVLKYAKEQGYAADMPNAPLERVLERAHRDMNEDKFLDHRLKLREKGKDAPSPNNKGTGPKKIVDNEAPTSKADFRKRALGRFGLGD